MFVSTSVLTIEEPAAPLPKSNVLPLAIGAVSSQTLNVTPRTDTVKYREKVASSSVPRVPSRPASVTVTVIREMPFLLAAGV